MTWCKLVPGKADIAWLRVIARIVGSERPRVRPCRPKSVVMITKA